MVIFFSKLNSVPGLFLHNSELTYITFYSWTSGAYFTCASLNEIIGK